MSGSRMTPIVSNERFTEAWELLGEGRVVSLRDINHAAAACYNVTYVDLISPRKEHAFFLARALAIYVAKTVTPYSYPMIGKHMGKKDHSTILRAYRRAQEIYEDDPHFANMAENLIARFGNI